MTNEVIAKIKELGYHNALRARKELYNRAKVEGNWSEARQERSFINGYLIALEDAEILSALERRTAFVYYTL